MKLNDTMNGLYVVDNFVEDAKAVIVINHGFAEYTGRYDWVTQVLNDNGYSVVRYDVKEHGNSIGKIESYQDMIADLRGVVIHARDSHPNTPIYNLGHSMGGLITAMMGIEFGDLVDGQILSGPAVGNLPAVRGIKRPFLKLAGNLLPNMMINNVVENDICSDPEVVSAYKQDPMVIKKARAHFLKEFTVSAPQFIYDNAKSYQCNLLILHGEQDIIVPPSVSEWFFEHVSSSSKKRITYPGLYHEILNEPSKMEVMSDILEWLEYQLESRK